MKRIFLSFLLGGLLCTLCAAPAAASDSSPIDIQRHPLGTAINTLLEAGIVSVDATGRFRPDHPITRGDAAAFLEALVKTAGLLPVASGGEAGIVVSDREGSFRPEDSMTRGEFDVMLFHWAAPAVESSGEPDAAESPDVALTRGEAAEKLYRYSGLEPVPPVITIPSLKVIEVPYISQISPVPAYVGCEAVSLLMGLKGKGYAADVDLRTFLDALPKHPSNPAKGFAGSPYIPDLAHKVRTTIYPAKLAEYGNQFGSVTDLSGCSPTELQAEVLAGNPVVAYVTLWWDKPYYRTYLIEGEPQRLLTNNHAVLVCGYDAASDCYYISDPYNLREKDRAAEYKYWIDGELFDFMYNLRRHAVAVE